MSNMNSGYLGLNNREAEFDHHAKIPLPLISAPVLSSPLLSVDGRRLR